MAAPNYTEWRNDNFMRVFPFADDMMLTSVDNYRLPRSVFLDAFFYPIDITGNLYLSEISIHNSRMTVSDSSGEIATAQFTPGDRTINFYDSYDRHIGTAVVSDDFDNISNELVFTASSTLFAAACVSAQNQAGVRGFLLPDGTAVAGEVIFEGIDGIVVDSRIEDGKNILRINAIGVQELPDCVDLADPVQCIDVNQLNAGSLTISRIDTSIFLAHRSELDEMCTNKDKLPDDDGNLPGDNEDPCDPDPPPGPCPPNPPWTPPGLCPTDPAFYYITALGSLMKIESYTGNDGGVELLEYIDDPQLPPKGQQGLKISLRGISEGAK